MTLKDTYEDVKKQYPEVMVGIIVDFKDFYMFSDNKMTHMNTGHSEKISFSELEKKFIMNSTKDIIVRIEGSDSLLDYYNSNKWKKKSVRRSKDKLEKQWNDFIKSQQYPYN